MRIGTIVYIELQEREFPKSLSQLSPIVNKFYFPKSNLIYKFHIFHTISIDI
jgi:hypothetical protein